MSAVCARCSQVHDQGTTCPRCGSSPPERGDQSPPPSHGPRWLQTSWGRIAIGLILAQGLFYGLRHLVTGLFLAAGGEADEVWGDLRNLIVLQAIQLGGLLLGGVLAGGGQRSGYFLGGMVGAWSGALAVVLRQNPLQELTPIVLYGQPLLHVFIGALGGAIGAFIWKPIPLSGIPVALAPPRKVVPQRRKPPLLHGKIHYVRVTLGTALAVAGTLSATMIFDKVLDLSGGKLGTSGVLQDQLITWEIKALSIILGGALAGATTANGIKQGLCVGVMASVLLIGIQAPKTDRWIEVALFTVISTLTLGLAGGWFGGALFPPTVSVGRRRPI